MVPQVVWKGTELESRELLAAIEHNCECDYAMGGARTKVCQPHDALVRDQRWLDGLLFGRRIADRLRLEEWRRFRPAPLAAPAVEKSANRPMRESAL